MCGLVGVVMHRGHADWERLRGALTRIAHRGPDGEGLVGISAQGHAAQESARIALGFCRLSILDLSHGADQPMRDAHTGNIIVFNGEIYNFLELRAELESRGHSFRTQGDTEVILAGYRQWGEGVFTRMNGMWAIALYDARENTLLLSRDRMGVKPLYVAADGEKLAFGSEIRAVAHMLNRTVGMNEAAAFDYLAGIQIDHQDDTLWDGIISVPGGGLWRVDGEGSITRGRYHDWPSGESPKKFQDLQLLFTDAVRLRLRSDAPTVSLLSGGLDSSITTWVAATQNKDQPRTKFVGAFSYGYDDDAYAEHDEIARAQALIAALPEKIDHTILRMSPVPTLDELLAMTVSQELPSTTPSIIASWRLYQRIREQGIKVVISGEGADELFAGYTRRYMPMMGRDYWRKERFEEVVKLLRSPHLTMNSLLNRLAWDMPSAVLRPMLRNMRPNIASMHADFWAGNADRFELLREAQRATLPEQLRRDVIRSAMPQILRYSDRNSMAASIEVRLPFMDYRMVEFALTTPVAQKLSRQGGKQILRQAFRGIVPDAVLAQPKTHGFGNAEQYQVLKLSLSPLLERAPAQAWHYIDRDALAKQLAQPTAHPMIWLPVSLLLWMTARHEQTL